MTEYRQRLLAGSMQKIEYRTKPFGFGAVA